jgi:NAD(P)H dehydrogenase (quinone)
MDPHVPPELGLELGQAAAGGAHADLCGGELAVELRHGAHAAAILDRDLRLGGLGLGAPVLRAQPRGGGIQALDHVGGIGPIRAHAAIFATAPDAPAHHRGQTPCVQCSPACVATRLGRVGVIAVTGATGGVGGRIARLLGEHEVEQRLIVRDAARAPELDGAQVRVVSGYDDPERMRAALNGAGTLMLIPAGEARDRVERLHRPVVDAAVAAGIERIVYTSFVNNAPDSAFTFARDHFHTEQMIEATGLDSTFLRMSLYTDFLPMLVGPDGVIRGPAGDGRFAPVTRDDLAESAVAVLTQPGHDGRTYDITGPETITMREVSALLAQHTTGAVGYEDETLEQARASRAGQGEDWEIEGWIGTYLAVANGELDVASDAVESLTFHRPQSVADHLSRTHGV